MVEMVSSSSLLSLLSAVAVEAAEGAAAAPAGASFYRGGRYPVLPAIKDWQLQIIQLSPLLSPLSPQRRAESHTRGKLAFYYLFFLVCYYC